MTLYLNVNCVIIWKPTVLKEWGYLHIYFSARCSSILLHIVLNKSCKSCQLRSPVLRELRRHLEAQLCLWSFCHEQDERYPTHSPHIGGPDPGQLRLRTWWKQPGLPSCTALMQWIKFSFATCKPIWSCPSWQVSSYMIPDLSGKPSYGTQSRVSVQLTQLPPTL